MKLSILSYVLYLRKYYGRVSPFPNERGGCTRAFPRWSRFPFLRHHRQLRHPSLVHLPSTYGEPMKHPAGCHGRREEESAVVEEEGSLEPKDPNESQSHHVSATCPCTNN